MFKYIEASEIENVLNKEKRQYLVGDLKKPQRVHHFKKKDIEIGITDYDVNTIELPHYHSVVTEYQYVISGITMYMDLKTGEVFRFKKGDFFLIETNTLYAQKSTSGTRIIFIKTPSINDKHEVEASEEVIKWLKEDIII